MLVKCPECGARVSETAHACPKCGFEWKGPLADGIEVWPASTWPTTQKEMEKKKREAWEEQNKALVERQKKREEEDRKTAARQKKINSRVRFWDGVELIVGIPLFIVSCLFLGAVVLILGVLVWQIIKLLI